MLKRILFVCFVAVTASLQAQFKITEDTLYAYGFAGTKPTDFFEIYAETHIISLSNSDERIQWIRSTNDLPTADWTSAVCDIVACRSSETDTGSFLFEKGDTGFMSFHFYVKNVKGNGKMVVRFFRTSNPMEYVDIVTFGTSWKPVGIHDLNISMTSVNPNPARNVIQLSNDRIETGNFEILNALGQVVMTGIYVNNMQMDISGISHGVYSLRVYNGFSSSVTRLVKE